MSHLDEGTLHALLDGELDLAEVSEIQKHLGSCVACGSRLQEVKQVLAEADRLVGAMEVPAGAPRSRPEPPRAAEPSPPRFEPSHAASAWDEPPVLLVPDPIDPGVTRRRWMRGLALAATLAGVIFGGKLIGSAFQPSHPVLPERDLTAASPAAPPPAVVSREESQKPASTLATKENKQPRTQRAPVAAAPKAAPVPDEVTSDTQVSADAYAAKDSGVVDSLAQAAQAASDSVNQGAALAAGAAAGSSASGAGQQPTQQSNNEADAATRR